VTYEWSVFCRVSQGYDARGRADTLEAAKAAATAALTPDMLAATKRYTLEVEGPKGECWTLIYGNDEGWVQA
jgi:hypothetical protein